MSGRGKWERPSMEERFHMKYIPEPNSGCWIWIGKLNVYGYGKITKPGDRRTKMRSAHRVSYEMHVSDIPKGLYVCHKCDVRCCVNPEHLFLGTAAENSGDMARKKRSTMGEKNPMSKLSDDKVRKILSNPNRSASEFSKQFGVSHKTIRLVRKRKIWRHVND